MEDCSHIMLQDTKDGQTRRVPLLKRLADIMHERKERGLHMPFEGFSGAKLRNNYKKMRTEIGYKDDPEFIPHLIESLCQKRLTNFGGYTEIKFIFLVHWSRNLQTRE